MHDRASSHILQQIALTASPSLQLPTAVTLPYSFKSLPPRLPPPSTGDASTGYIISPSGNVSMTPQDVIRSCHVLLQHLQSQRSAAEKALRDWEKSIEDRELIEKRRVAPGYLDTGIQLLKPTRVGGGGGGEVESVMDMDEVQDQRSKEAGEELDRVFGRA